MFDFKLATVFCLGYRLSKHKITTYFKKLWGGMAPWSPLATPVVHSWSAFPTIPVSDSRWTQHRCRHDFSLKFIAVWTDHCI